MYSLRVNEPTYEIWIFGLGGWQMIFATPDNELVVKEYQKGVEKYGDEYIKVVQRTPEVILPVAD